MRWLLAFAPVLLLVGCGAMASERAAAPVVPDAPAPAIVAVSEAPPDDVSWFLRAEFGLDASPVDSGSSGQGFEVCLGGASGSGPSAAGDASGNSCPQPTVEEQARMRVQARQYEQALRPAGGSEARVIAKLPLSKSADLLFTAWKSSSGALCWQTDESGPDGGGGGGGVSGPCVQEAEAVAYPEFGTRSQTGVPCDVICLSSDGGTSGDGADIYLLAGTVPSDAEALRVTMAGGATATYPLVGPRVLDTERRVFMLDLGADDWRKLELIRGGAVAATVEVPAVIAAYEDCSHKIGPPPNPPATTDLHAMVDAMKPYQAAMTACVDASGALPPAGFPLPPRFP